MSGDVLVQAVGYGVVGSMLGVIGHVAFTDELVESGRVPAEAAMAVPFLIGLLWPLALCVGASWLLWAFGRTTARSFVALWQHLRPTRIEVPRATAKERAP